MFWQPVSSYFYYRFGSHQSGICLFVTSTFGNGDPPRMAEKTAEWIDKQMDQNDLMVNEEVNKEKNYLYLNGKK